MARREIPLRADIDLFGNQIELSGVAAPRFMRRDRRLTFAEARARRSLVPLEL